MKDLHKIVEGENTENSQNDPKKEKSKHSMVKKVVTANKIMTEPNETPNIADLTNITTEASAEVVPNDVYTNKEAKPVNKKVVKAEAKVAVVKLPKKQKTKVEPMVQNVVIVDPKEEKENTDPDISQKEKLKEIKKKAKKAEEKVDKLKKKVKKAKKKEVKPSKLKALKEKLEKANVKLKTSVKKLKKEKQ